MNKLKPSANAPKPLTEEEKRNQIARFLGQKRESLATGILFNLCNGANVQTTAEGVSLVDMAVEMSDHLMEKLFPIKEENTDKAAE